MTSDRARASVQTTLRATSLNAPANGVSKSLRVPFGFVSDETGATFLCSLDGLGFAPCANPTTVREGRGPGRPQPP